MLDLIEKTNGDIVVLMAFSVCIGILAGIVAMSPTITKLQTSVRSLKEALTISRNNASSLYVHCDHLEQEIKDLLSFVESNLPEGGGK